MKHSIDPLLRPLHLEAPHFDQHLFRLRFTHRASFPFEHGGILRGVLSRALERHALPPGVIPYAPEAGRVRFERDDPYHLGLTLVGPARRFAEPLRRGIERLGQERVHGRAPVLGGNFTLEDWQCPATPDLAADVDEEGPLEIEMLSPLRVERPRELKERGAGYLNGNCFPATWFLELLWRRIFFLSHERYPEADERDAVLGDWPANLVARPKHLLWVDMPVRGSEAKGRPYTLGGVRGRVVFEGLPAAWRALMLLGGSLHAGQKTHYGLGRYVVTGTAEASSPAFRPARTLLEASLRSGLGSVVGPALWRFLDEASFAYRRGFSHQAARQGLTRARREGFQSMRGQWVDELGGMVDPYVVLARLRALYPGEPMVDFVAEEIRRSGGFGGRDRSLWRMLLPLAIGDVEEALRKRGMRLGRKGDEFLVLGRAA